MIDVLATLCLLDDPETCATRAVPLGAATCAEAMGAALRLNDWAREHTVADVRCGTMEASPLAFEEVRPGLLVHRADVAVADPENGGDIGNVVIVLGNRAVAVIDAGGSRAMGEAVVAAVRAATDLPIETLILTHGHPDHVLGATALTDAGAEVIGHARLPEWLAARAEAYLDQGWRHVGQEFIGSSLPQVVRTVKDTTVIDLGSRVLEVQAWGPAHTDADLTVLDRTTGTLIAGDLIFDVHVPTLDGALTGWLDVLDDMALLNATAVVPGHGGPLLPWPNGAEAERRYLETLSHDVRALLAEGATVGEAAERAAASERSAWSLFAEHNLRNATEAYTELEWE